MNMGLTRQHMGTQTLVAPVHPAPLPIVLALRPARRTPAAWRSLLLRTLLWWSGGISDRRLPNFLSPSCATPGPPL